MKEFQISSQEEGQRLEKYIKRVLPEAGTAFVYKMLRKKNIELNGAKATGKEMVKKGDKVTFYLSDETFGKFAGDTGRGKVPAAGRTGSAPQVKTEVYQAAYQKISAMYRSLKVVYENEHILIANKPAGLLSQKAGEADQSLNEWFVGYLLDKGQATPETLRSFTPSIANRLDRNTSGLVLCGKTLRGSQTLAKLLRERTIRKFYHMVVAGNVEKGGRLQGYLVKDEAANQVKIYDSKVDGSSEISTIYEPIGHKGNALTMLEAELVTGKTHQLRAHFASIGHPILGDTKYGDRNLNQAYQREGVTRQLLCCVRLEFPKMQEEMADLSQKVISIEEPSVYRAVMSRD